MEIKQNATAGKTFIDVKLWFIDHNAALVMNFGLFIVLLSCHFRKAEAQDMLIKSSLFERRCWEVR